MSGDRFYQSADDVVSKREKLLLADNAQSLLVNGCTENLPPVIQFMTNTSYTYTSRTLLEQHNSRFVRFQDEVMLPQLRRRTGHPELMAIKPTGKSLYQRLSSCKLHHLKEGDSTGWHQDTQTRSRGQFLFTCIYNVQITVDGEDTLDPEVRDKARVDGRLPVMHLFNSEERVLKTFELYTGLMLFHNGLADYHSVPKLKKGVERTCCVMFTTENLSTYSAIEKLPFVYREAIGLYRNKRLIEQVTGKKLQSTGVEYMHVLVVALILIICSVIGGAIVALGITISRLSGLSFRGGGSGTPIHKDV
jgi:hypothetical protein